MGDTPVFKLDDEAVCYRFCTDMIAGREADDTLWAEAQAVFGETGVTELLGLLGLYTSVCLTMVGYRMPTKNGEPEPLP